MGQVGRNVHFVLWMTACMKHYSLWNSDVVGVHHGTVVVLNKIYALFDRSIKVLSVPHMYTDQPVGCAEFQNQYRIKKNNKNKNKQTKNRRIMSSPIYFDIIW